MIAFRSEQRSTESAGDLQSARRQFDIAVSPSSAEQTLSLSSGGALRHANRTPPAVPVVQVFTAPEQPKNNGTSPSSLRTLADSDG